MGGEDQMNGNHTKRNLIIVCSCLLVLAAVLVLWRVVFRTKTEPQAPAVTELPAKERQIELLELGGPVRVERGADSMDASQGQSLQNGDTIVVGENGSARVRLDDDKYLYIDGSSKVRLLAEGTAESSQTIIYVESGSVLTEVRKKLSETSSFHIVSANTLMVIRGTKTLTQVIEDAVTGHVQTSNAVLEGQVKIKAVKVKADGTVVSVEKDLGAGEGNSFLSSKEELVSLEEMESIANTGAGVNGVKVEIVTEEEAEVVFDVATFAASFLENVKSLLVADAQADAGEGGLSQEQIELINEQLDRVMESFWDIPDDFQQEINNTKTADEEPTEELSPVQQTEPSTNIATVDEESTTVNDGTTNLVVIGGDDDDAGNRNGDGSGACQHQYVTRVTAPTCTTEGYTLYHCEKCGDEYRSDYTQALGHDLAHHDGKDATCTEDGWKAYDDCSRCDYTTYEAVRALGHDLVHHAARAVTCEEIGWDAYDTCSRCDHTTYHEIAALGHEYGDWVIVTEPYAECTEDHFLIAWHAGTKVKTCAHCNGTISEPILVTPVLMSEIDSQNRFPILIFTNFDTETYGEDPLLGEFLDRYLWPASPSYEGDWLGIEADLIIADGDKPLSELNLEVGSTIEVTIRVQGDYRDTYEDTVATITITEDWLEPWD